MQIYTDGACSSNPGKGGWAFAYENNQTYHFKSGFLSLTTNNQMELEAVIQAFIFAANYPNEKHTIFTDSKYVHDGLLNWMPNWKKNNWIGSNRKPVKNQEYWHRLDQVSQQKNVEIKWVKGHSDNKGNQIVDQIAVCASHQHINCKCVNFILIK